jgi:hypothetical protein
MIESRQISPPHWKPQFSLLTTLLLVTIVGLLITVVQLWRAIGPLRYEVGKLRTEQGLLVIEDETKVHAIQLPELDRAGMETRKYRVYIPHGKEYRAVLALNRIPYSGIAPIRRPLPRTKLGQTAGALVADLAEGEHLMTVGFVTDSNGVQHIAFESRGPGSMDMPWMIVPDREAWPIRESGNVAEVNEVSTTTEMADDKNELVLIRYRRQFQAEDAVSFGSYDDGTLADGFMLWIEPISETVETSE